MRFFALSTHPFYSFLRRLPIPYYRFHTQERCLSCLQKVLVFCNIQSLPIFQINLKNLEMIWPKYRNHHEGVKTSPHINELLPTGLPLYGFAYFCIASLKIRYGSSHIFWWEHCCSIVYRLFAFLIYPYKSINMNTKECKHEIKKNRNYK